MSHWAATNLENSFRAPRHSVYSLLNSAGGMNTIFPSNIPSFGVSIMVVESALKGVQLGCNLVIIKVI